MWRERALKTVLVLVGLLFTAGVYPLIGSLLHPADSDTGTVAHIMSLREGTMNKERALKVVLVLVGLLFLAGIYPLVMMVKQEPALAMMLTLYVTLGIFLLLAARNPSANRSLIAFTAWSSFAHAALMAVQTFLNLIPRRELVGVVLFILIGVALIALAPAKKSVERVSVAIA